MKKALIKFLRKRQFQQLWEKLHHLSKIGMNHWGGASLYESGEIYAIQYVYKKLKPLDKTIIFDVGANQGEYALLLNKIFSNKVISIFSFEPSIDTFKSLVENTLATDTISPVNIGLGEKKEKLNLYSSGKGSPIASVYNLTNSISTFKEEYTEKILITTIDSYCQDLKIKTIDFLKIDIEGHELFALKGAINLIQNRKIQFIQFEFGECHIDSKTFFRDFYDLLNKNYIFYRIVSNGLRRINHYTTDLEIFNTANFLAELKDRT